MIRNLTCLLSGACLLLLAGCETSPEAAGQANLAALAPSTDGERQIAIDDLPAHVRDAALNAVNGIVLEEADVEEEDGQLVYDVEGEADGIDYEIEVTAEGAVLEIEQEAGDDDADEDGEFEDDDEDDDDDDDDDEDEND